jgi:hypothetical protein
VRRLNVRSEHRGGLDLHWPFATTRDAIPHGELGGHGFTHDSTILLSAPAEAESILFPTESTDTTEKRATDRKQTQDAKKDFEMRATDPRPSVSPGGGGKTRSQ